MTVIFASWKQLNLCQFMSVVTYHNYNNTTIIITTNNYNNNVSVPVIEKNSQYIYTVNHLTNFFIVEASALNGF